MTSLSLSFSLTPSAEPPSESTTQHQNIVVQAIFILHPSSRNGSSQAGIALLPRLDRVRACPCVKHLQRERGEPQVSRSAGVA